MHMDTECRPNSEEAKLRRGQIQKRPNSEETKFRRGHTQISQKQNKAQRAWAESAKGVH